MYMRPISRPKNVLASARWNSVIGRRRSATGRSNSRAPSGPEQVRPRSGPGGARASSGVEQIVGDRVDHRQQAVASVRSGRPAGGSAARHRPSLGSKQPVAHQHPVDQQQPAQVRDPAGRRCARARSPERPGRPRCLRELGAQGAEGVGLQHDGPGRAEPRGQLRVGRLQRVVPVAVPVRGQRVPRSVWRRCSRAPLDVVGHRRRRRTAAVADEGQSARAGSSRRRSPPGTGRGRAAASRRRRRATSGWPGCRCRSRKSKACGQSPRAFCAPHDQQDQARAAPSYAPRVSSRPTGPWLTSRVPQAPPVYCSSPRGDR